MEVDLSDFKYQTFPFDDLTFCRYLFNSTSYLKEYPTDDLVRFEWQNKKNRSIALTGILTDGKFKSIPWATFGGVECSSQSTSSDVEQFVSQLIFFCQQQGIKEVRITLPPDAHYEAVYDLKDNLVKQGFKVVQSDTNQHIEVLNLPYRELIAYNELKKLKKSEAEGFTFHQLDRSDLKQAYALIKDNRVRKGFPVSMSFEALDNMFEKLPDTYKLFGIRHKDRLIATAVSIHIGPSSLYNFYHGDHAEYRVFSPVVMLLEGIYKYCQSHDIKVLDLGISSEKGVVNDGLFRFKKNCGAKSSKKNTLLW